MKKQWIIVLLGSFCMTLNAQQDRQENTEQTDVDGFNLKYDFDKITDRKGTDCLKYDFAKERGRHEGILPLLGS